MRITNKEQLAAHGNREGRKIVAELLDAGLDALDPYVRVKQLVHVENGKIVLHTDGFEMKGDPHAGPLEFDLKDYDRVYVIGAAKGVQRAALAAALIEELDKLYAALQSGDTASYLTAYRCDCLTLGREVQLLWQNVKEKVTALDVDDQFGLVVRRADGTVETIRTGEVSVRGLYGYVE